MNGKKAFSRILVAAITGVLLMCPVLAASTFPDVDENATYAEAAEYLNEISVMQGDTQGNFNPEKSVTRAQMAAIVCRMFGEDGDLTTNGDKFSDVPASYWANGYIIRAASLGIIGGYSDGSFRPYNTVTYEQAIAMILRALGLADEGESAGGYPDGYVRVAEKYSFTEDFSTKKGDLMTRWQIACMLYKIAI